MYALLVCLFGAGELSTTIVLILFQMTFDCFCNIFLLICFYFVMISIYLFVCFCSHVRNWGVRKRIWFGEYFKCVIFLSATQIQNIYICIYFDDAINAHAYDQRLFFFFFLNLALKNVVNLLKLIGKWREKKNKTFQLNHTELHFKWWWWWCTREQCRKPKEFCVQSKYVYFSCI